LKRCLEILLAGVLFLFLAPILAVLCLAVRWNSPGPALFRQERVGRDRRPFTCLKLRTMKTGTRQAGTHEIGADAVTGLGKILRKLKLDELPQLINVLRGEMSFVGPRPCLPSQTELVHEREIRGVLTILPGITGLGQVRGIDMSDPVRLAECDAEYLRRRSWTLDAAIVWRTLAGGGFGDRVRSESPPPTSPL
jgi:O-antigen biosynthesis protein WbqP